MYNLHALHPDAQAVILGMREYLQENVAHGAAARDLSGEFPFQICQDLGKLGLMGALTPSEYGGMALDTQTFAYVLEELAAIDGSLCLIVASHNSLCQGHLLLAGSEAQKHQYLPALAAGMHLGAWALTEVHAGSDAAGVECHAQKMPDGRWCLNGSKMFISQGSVAETYVVIARTDPARPDKGRTDGLSAFVFNRSDVVGFRVGTIADKVGLRASDTAQLHFEQMMLPEDALLGVQGEAFKVVMQVLDGGRIGIASMAVGLARAALDAAVQHAQTRVQFGRTIGQQEAIAFKLAEMSTQLHASRLLVQYAAQLKDLHEPFTVAAAQAKLFASEASSKICDEAIQIFGGYGYLKNCPVERYWRDSRLTRIGEGTSEIQHLIIAKALMHL